MTRVNPTYLNELSNLNNLINNILYELDKTYSNPNYNFWYEPVSGLFYLIRDNFLSNVNSFNNTVFENDLFGFCGIKKNIRCNIEAYIDIFNLTYDKSINVGYINLLKFQHYKYLKKSFNNKLLSNDEFNHQVTTLNFNEQDYYDFISNYIDQFKPIRNFNKNLVSFSITKCTIAQCNGLYESNVEKYKNFFNKFSNFSHPNIFVDITNISHRIIECRELLLLDLELLRYSLICLIDYNVNRFANVSAGNLLTLRNLFDTNISNFNNYINNIYDITIIY